MQLRLDRKVALAEQYFNRAESVKEDYRASLASAEYFRFVEEKWAISGTIGFADRDWEELKHVREGSLSISSVAALTLIDRLQIVGYDNLYFQYKQGLLDEETWSGRQWATRSRIYGTLAVGANHAGPSMHCNSEGLFASRAVLARAASSARRGRRAQCD